MSKDAPCGPVAVIAIHGVADQQPDATARAIADLLLNPRKATSGNESPATPVPKLAASTSNGNYSAFVESGLRVAVRSALPDSKDLPEEARMTRALPGTSATLSKPSRKARLKRLFQFDPRGDAMQKSHTAVQNKLEAHEPGKPIEAKDQRTAEARLTEPPGVSSREPEDIAFMRSQLAEYEPSGKDAIFQTIQLRTVRTEGSPDNSPCEIHLFEMYWADLSRAASGIFRLLVEFYQLLFYLCTIGRKCIDFARLAAGTPKEGRAWMAFARWQVWAERSLTLIVPVLNLCLLGLALQSLPTHFAHKYHIALVIAALSLLTAAVSALLVYISRYGGLWRSGGAWFLRIGLVVLVTATVAALGLLLRKLLPNSDVLLAWLIWGVAAFSILGLMFIYQARKVGASLVAVVVVLIVTLLFWIGLNRSSLVPEARVLHAALWATEWTFALLCLCWIAFGLFCIGARLQGFRAIQVSSDKDAAKRAVWTVHVTLFLPALLSALLNLVLWQALFLATKKFVPAGNYEPTILSRWIEPGSIVEFTRQLIGLTAGQYFLLAFLLAIFAVILFVWALFPVIFSEFKIPAGPEEPRWLGLCLDRSLRVARFAGQLLAALIMLIPVIYFVTWKDPRYSWLDGNFGTVSLVVLTGVGSIVLLFLTSSKLPFKVAGLGFRPAVDIAMDVANWLRLYPIDKNPKARIAARFVSLLRHVCHWRDRRTGTGYQALVLIAHSQGTIIAAEVLRFLHLTQHPLLRRFGSKIPIYLFTMGCPLRQLYSLRFPHHYGWARHNDPSWPGSAPDPANLEVKKWVNAYRSGDYIGRYLWYRGDEAKEPQFDLAKVREDAGQIRRERCIGSGAHIRYWDDSAPLIAEELDALIGSACNHGAAQNAGRTQMPAGQPKTSM